jgi:hypothetical protein
MPLFPIPHIDLSSIFIFLGSVIIFVLITREVVTWYWKLNKISDLLEKIEENTRPKGTKPKEAETFTYGNK